MKTTIFYFSGTGNTLKVARELSEQIGDTELVSIPKVIGKDKIKADSENIGIMFPVYAFDMPVMVKKFIDKLEMDMDKYYFAVCTYGAIPGATLKFTAKRFKTNGGKLSAGFMVRMPGNAIVMYDVWSDEKQKKIFSNAQQKINEIVPKIMERNESNPEKGFWLLNCILGIPRPLFAIKPGDDKKYWVDDNCNGCGICEALCPAGNIKMVSDKPEWQHKCEQCLGCLNWCPKHAIQYGKKTSQRGRYHHPGISAKDLFARDLQKE